MARTGKINRVPWSEIGNTLLPHYPYVISLAAHLAMPLPPWIHEKDAVDNWQTSAWERNPRQVAETVANACQQAREVKSKMAAN